jgi:hypothetical protein
VGGVELTTHWITGTQIRGYWAYTPAETPVANIGVWLQTLTEEYPNPWLWSGLSVIEAWNPERPDCPPDLRTKSALYHPGERKIQLRTYELNGGQLAHECGHHAQIQLRIGTGSDRIGKALWAAFVAMAMVKDKTYAEQVEHFAEAWRYLFYPDKRAPFNLPAGMKELFHAMREAR